MEGRQGLRAPHSAGVLGRPGGADLRAPLPCVPGHKGRLPGPAAEGRTDPQAAPRRVLSPPATRRRPSPKLEGEGILRPGSRPKPPGAGLALTLKGLLRSGSAKGLLSKSDMARAGAMITGRRRRLHSSAPQATPKPMSQADPVLIPPPARAASQRARSKMAAPEVRC